MTANSVFADAVWRAAAGLVEQIECGLQMGVHRAPFLAR